MAVVVCIVFVAPSGQSKTQGHFYFAAPGGKPAATGTERDPLDLTTALSSSSPLKPGDTLWLRGGSYGDDTKQINSRIAGMPDMPIVVRQRVGERAVIHGGLAIYSPFTWYWGFEVTNGNPDRKEGATRPECIDTYQGSRGVKLINLVLHDCLQGIGFWVDAVDAEATGNLIYYNGESGSKRGLGHAIYTQNATGTKKIIDNIMFDQFDIGLQAYGSSKAFVRGYDVEGNVSFNNGSPVGANVDDILFAAPGGVDNLTLKQNFTYQTPDADKGQSRLGWQFGGDNGTISASDNYWIGGNTALEMRNWAHVLFTGNVTYAAKSLNLLLAKPSWSNGGYKVDNNTYYGSGIFNFNGSSATFAEWTGRSNFDRSSHFHQGRPTGTWTFVRRNGYEADRANIVIYNWDRKSDIPVDLSTVLNPGDAYVVRDAQNYFGAPVAAGRWVKGLVSIPMRGLAKARPVGDVPVQPAHTAPEFGVFIVSRR